MHTYDLSEKYVEFMTKISLLLVYLQILPLHPVSVYIPKVYCFKFLSISAYYHAFPSRTILK